MLSIRTTESPRRAARIAAKRPVQEPPTTQRSHSAMTCVSRAGSKTVMKVSFAGFALRGGRDVQRATLTTAVEFVPVELVEVSFFLPPQPPFGQDCANADETVNARTNAAERMSDFITTQKSLKSSACQMESPSFVSGNAKFSTGGRARNRSQRASMTEEGVFMPGDGSSATARRKISRASPQSPRA